MAKQKTAPVVPVNSAAVAERMVVARIGMLMKLPFWGNLVTRLRLVEVDDIPTAATDGRRILYNANFVNSLTDRNLIFLMTHELLHVVFDHLPRWGSRDKMLANIAADFVVNQVLVDNKVGDHIGNHITKSILASKDSEAIKAIGTLYDARYRGWTFEQVYDDLQDIADTIKEKCGSNYIGIDEHIDGEGEGEGTKATTISAEEMQAIRDEWREAVLNAAQSSGAGSVPGEIQRLIGELTEPKMDWRQLLTQTIESQIKSDTTFIRPGRRSFSSDFIFPSRTKDPCVNVTLGLDMSGSIGPVEIREFFSEVIGIVAQYASFNIDIFCWDTKVYNFQSFTEDNVHDIMEYQPMGGGGTDLTHVFEYFVENDIQPKQLCIFTDGEIGGWGDPNYCETLFIIKNRNQIEAPYGTTVEYR